MTNSISKQGPRLFGSASRLMPPPPLFLIQPLLDRIMRQVVARHPELLERLGQHQTARFLIDPINLPFVLHLVPAPDNLVFRACQRSEQPTHDARIAASFLDLLRLVDCSDDSDAMFFSRDLDISGDTEAVVALRNALDNVDGSIAMTAANTLGPLGRVALDLFRRLSGHHPACEHLHP